MNRNKILQLADFIEMLPESRFHMSWWSSIVEDNWSRKASDMIDINVCGTAGCIAGWAIAIEEDGVAKFPVITNPVNANYIMVKAANILDLSFNKAKELFIPDDETFWGRYFESTKQEMIDNGEFFEGGGDFPYFDLIDNKLAARVLREIVNGEVVL